jgi:hypothetical protein
LYYIYSKKENRRYGKQPQVRQESGRGFTLDRVLTDAEALPAEDQELLEH